MKILQKGKKSAGRSKDERGNGKKKKQKPHRIDISDRLKISKTLERLDHFILCFFPFFPSFCEPSLRAIVIIR